MWIRDAVNATGRPMVLNIKFDVEPEGFASAFEIANTWRVSRSLAIHPCLHILMHPSPSRLAGT